MNTLKVTVTFLLSVSVTLLTGCGGDSPTNPSTQNINLDFKNFDESRIVDQGFFIEEGIQIIRAKPSDDYCSEARPTILAAGTYDAPVSFLSTATPGELNSCNVVPLEFVFSNPASKVTIHFFGADADYTLTAWGVDGTRLGSATTQANPYDYDQPSTVSYTSGNTNISRITFGRLRSITMVVSFIAIH